MLLLSTLTILSFQYWTVVVEAFPIKYSFTGIGAFGDFNGTLFDDVGFKISITRDTANVDTTTDPNIPTLSNLNGTITISGTGIHVVGRFSDPLSMFTNLADQAVGFGNTALGDLTDLFVPGAGLNAYDLKSVFGPITAGESVSGSTLFFYQFGGVTLDIGSLTFDDIGDVTFSAAPKPPVTDYNGDGKSDVLWYQATLGAVGVWLMNGAFVSSVGIPGEAGTNWQISGTGDFDGDGKTDILWQDGTTGEVSIWLMNGTAIASIGFPGTVSNNWQITGVGDFNGDGKADILWQDSSTGTVAIWFIDGTGVASIGVPGQVGSDWQIKGDGDYAGDGNADILWYHPATGTVAMWLMTGESVSSVSIVGAVATEWQIMNK
jgi:hypothetical protein